MTRVRRHSDRTARRALVWLVVLGILAGSAATLAAQERPQGETEFRVGDRIILRVAGEPLLTDTFTVSNGPTLVLPIVGSVSLAGVRRSQVQDVLTAAIAKFYRDPTVRVRSLLRVAVLGEVVKPGFYSLPADAVVSEALMAAGGPTTGGQVSGLRIVRDGVDLIPKDSTRKAIDAGMTLGQLGVRSDDQLVVPRAPDAERTLRIVSALITIPLAVLTVLLISRR